MKKFSAVVTIAIMLSFIGCGEKVSVDELMVGKKLCKQENNPFFSATYYSSGKYYTWTQTYELEFYDKETCYVDWTWDIDYEDDNPADREDVYFSDRYVYGYYIEEEKNAITEEKTGDIVVTLVEKSNYKDDYEEIYSLGGVAAPVNIPLIYEIEIRDGEPAMAHTYYDYEESRGRISFVCK